MPWFTLRKPNTLRTSHHQGGQWLRRLDIHFRFFFEGRFRRLPVHFQSFLFVLGRGFRVEGEGSEISQTIQKQFCKNLAHWTFLSAKLLLQSCGMIELAEGSGAKTGQKSMFVRFLGNDVIFRLKSPTQLDWGPFSSLSGISQVQLVQPAG